MIKYKKKLKKLPDKLIRIENKKLNRKKKQIMVEYMREKQKLSVIKVK